MSALLWLAGGLILLIAEVLGADLVLLMLAGGALSAAGVDFFFDTPLWVEVLVFAVVSSLLLLGVRPIAKRHMFSAPPVPSNIEALEGRQAMVTETVDDNDGRIKLDGDIWSARTLELGDVIEPGTTVRVAQIDGATAVVWRG